MSHSSYRIYLAYNYLGRLQQINKITRDFYDVVPHLYIDADHTRWYRMTSTSPGRAYTALWKAAPAHVTDYVTITELGARMRLFSDQWYVDSSEIDLAQARNLQHLVLTWPKALSLSMAAIVLAYMAFTLLYAGWTGHPMPPVQPLARFAAFTMLGLIGAEHLLAKLQRWMRDSLGVW
jgi:hypothetical protein